MTNPFITNAGRSTSFVAGGRNYDYRRVYNEDKMGEEGEENARVWNVYLDEAENHDADMIQGFRDVIDGLLVFASLFSAVVTTFVIQTSQDLQPDNTQILASLLLETNQLLRAASNASSINFVPPSALRPGSSTHTSIDVWVNGFFFASLGLSLSTALLTVLVKQWIQAYVAIVPGHAKIRVLTRHFRFKGIIKWKLHSIVESLPLILHASVGLFLTGLSLFVSQLNSPIFYSVVSISAVTFIVYLGSAALSTFYIDCPFRIPLLSHFVQYFLFGFSFAKYLLSCMISKCLEGKPLNRPIYSHKALKDAEQDAIFPRSPPDTAEAEFSVPNKLICDSFSWMYHYSSNFSVKEVVVIATAALLERWKSFEYHLTDDGNSLSRYKILNLGKEVLHHANFVSDLILFSLRMLARMDSILQEEAMLHGTIWIKLIRDILWGDDFCIQIKDCTFIPEEVRRQVQDELTNTFKAASLRGDSILAKQLLEWGSDIPREGRLPGTPFLHDLAAKGEASIIKAFAHRVDVNEADDFGNTALHFASLHGELQCVVALVEQGHATLSPTAQDRVTPLDLAIEHGHSDVVDYLLDQGARPLQGASSLLHLAARLNASGIAILFLDKGLDRMARYLGETPYDVAVKFRSQETAEVLQSYTTVPKQCELR